MKTQLWGFALCRTTHNEKIAEFLIAEAATIEEIEKINNRMLAERKLPPEQQGRETKYMKAMQALIDSHHGPDCPFALDRRVVF